MRLALRAQNQARATLETLSTVKNPPHPATFVRQQNIAHGAQQVNNAEQVNTVCLACPRARLSKTGSPNFWSIKQMSHGWTPERRRRAAQLIHKWRPWEKSTGPRTEAGKARVARNGFTGGMRPALRALARLLREHQRQLTDL
jgi:hypothetical protein